MHCNSRTQPLMVPCHRNINLCLIRISITQLPEITFNEVLNCAMFRVTCLATAQSAPRCSYMNWKWYTRQCFLQPVHQSCLTRVATRSKLRAKLQKGGVTPHCATSYNCRNLSRNAVAHAIEHLHEI